MTEVKPFVHCVDYWPAGIPPEKLKAYKQLIGEKQINRPKVLVCKESHATVVEYEAIMPHEWVREELGKRV